MESNFTSAVSKSAIFNNFSKAFLSAFDPKSLSVFGVWFMSIGEETVTGCFTFNNILYIIELYKIIDDIYDNDLCWVWAALVTW